MSTRVIGGQFCSSSTAPASSFTAFTARASIKAQTSVSTRHIQHKSTHSRWQSPHFNYTVKMSSVAGAAASIGSAGLYAVVGNPAQVGAKPEEADAKAHHLKNGKGFTNPWDSYREWSAPKIVFNLLWCVE
jgi:hypothetical protein